MCSSGPFRAASFRWIPLPTICPPHAPDRPRQALAARHRAPLLPPVPILPPPRRLPHPNTPATRPAPVPHRHPEAVAAAPHAPFPLHPTRPPDSTIPTSLTPP